MTNNSIINWDLHLSQVPKMKWVTEVKEFEFKKPTKKNPDTKKPDVKKPGQKKK